MKDQFLLFLFLLFSIISQGQKKYHFDYAIEYDYQLSDTSKVEKVVCLTNSKDNSYLLKVKEKDSLKYELCFVDYKGLRSMIYIVKNDFFKAETINLKCQFVSKYVNSFKYQVDNYHFEVEPDTLIADKRYSHYVLRSNDLKREGRKKLARKYYIIEQNTSFHLPILDFETDYKEYKTEKNIPNGIAKTYYIKGVKTKNKYFIYSLTSFSAVNKTILIPQECDFTNP